MVIVKLLLVTVVVYLDCRTVVFRPANGSIQIIQEQSCSFAIRLVCQGFYDANLNEICL